MKLATNKTRRNYLVKEPNYHTANFFSESSLATEIKKTWILTNKPVYYIRNMYEFWYNLRETKIWQKKKKNNEIMLHGDAQRYNLLKNGRETFIPTFQKMLKQDLMLQI